MRKKKAESRTQAVRVEREAEDIAGDERSEALARRDVHAGQLHVAYRRRQRRMVSIDGCERAPRVQTDRRGRKAGEGRRRWRAGRRGRTEGSVHCRRVSFCPFRIVGNQRRAHLDLVEHPLYEDPVSALTHILLAREAVSRTLLTMIICRHRMWTRCQSITLRTRGTADHAGSRYVPL